MATVGLQPITLREATLTVGEDDFTAAVEKVLIVPEPSWSWAERLAGPDYPVFEGVRWTCTLGFAQDFTPGSLTMYLLEHVGEVRTILFTPTADGEPVLVQVLVVPGRLGGDPYGTLTSEAVLPVFGTPETGAES